MFQDYGYYMVGMHAFWWVFWIILVMAILFGGGWGRSERRQERQRETPHEILRRRLATGEIKPEEYQQHKALLDHDTSPK